MRDKVSDLHKTAGRITVGISVFSDGKWKAENTAPLLVVLHYCSNLYLAQFAHALHLFGADIANSQVKV